VPVVCWLFAGWLFAVCLLFAGWVAAQWFLVVCFDRADQGD
jgi:hypothetical protein